MKSKVIEKNQKKEKKLKPFEQAFHRQSSLVQDLLTYLCHDQTQITHITKNVLKSIKKNYSKNHFKEYERHWILKTTLDHAKNSLNQNTRKELTPEEIKLDTEGNAKQRLAHFYFYYERLTLSEKSILILRDQFGLSTDEVATITQIPEGAMQVKRNQAISKLAEWIWNTPKDDEKIKKIEKILSLPLIDVLKKSPSQKQILNESRWKRTPWFLRSGFESLLFALAILLVVIMVPKIKNFYEQNLKKRLDAFDLADLNATENEIAVLKANLLKNTVFGRPECEVAVDELPVIGCFISGLPLSAEIANHRDKVQFYFSKEELINDSDRNIASLSPIQKEFPSVKVGSSEIWRFNIRTDSPEDLREMVKEYLSKIDSMKNVTGTDGIKAPGGIQFNLIVPKKVVQGLKNKMHVIANTFIGDSTGENNEIFTWYKIKSRKRIPQGQTRVVIWLSQI